MKERTLKKLLLEAVAHAPPAMSGDMRAAFVLGFIINQNFDPESAAELFEACFAIRFDAALAALRETFSE